MRCGWLGTGCCDSRSHEGIAFSRRQNSQRSQAQGSRTESCSIMEDYRSSAPCLCWLGFSVCGRGQPAPVWGSCCPASHGAGPPPPRAQRPTPRRMGGLCGSRCHIPDSAVPIPLPRAFCSLVGTELESLLAYIYQPLHQHSQNSLMLRRRPQMPLSFLALHVYILLSQFEDQKAQEAEPEAQGEEGKLGIWVGGWVECRRGHQSCIMLGRGS